jgi:hypothetical protein
MKYVLLQPDLFEGSLHAFFERRLGVLGFVNDRKGSKIYSKQRNQDLGQRGFRAAAQSSYPALT